MVYCGKASLGCSSCRKRRIKCDRRQPECTQCVRLSKTCPGYRDQLSLMFRDETVKVEKKARASWGLDDSSSGAASSSAAQPASAKTAKPTDPTASSTRSDSEFIPTPPASTASTSPKSPMSTHARGEGPSSRPPPGGTLQRASSVQDGTYRPTTPYQTIRTVPSELGVSFYVQHYLVAYPDEVRNPTDLSGVPWFEHPSAQATMAAMGLAALGNLRDDKQLHHLSKIKYGEALALTNETLRNPAKYLDTGIRTTVMLALFQVISCIHTTHESHENARVHLLGCMALIKAALPIRTAPANGIRGVLQLCYSLLIPCVRSGVPMPDKFFDSIREGIEAGFLPEDEQPGVTLVHIIARYAGLSAAVRRTAHADGRDATADVMRQLLALDAAMDAWASSQRGKWRYETHTDASLPPAAVFRQTYHRYSDVWTSRIWNHFRWARLLTNQTLLEFAGRYPRSAAGVVPAARRDRARETIRQLAVDVLTSVPTHYKHPLLTYAQLDRIQTHGGAGAGSVGIPHLMFHLQVAACAPGVPYEVWEWAVDLMETAWRELGMLHAKSLAEVSKSHRAALDRLAPERILKTEPGLDEGGDAVQG